MDYKTLASGIEMPLLGFGVFQVQEKGAAKQAVLNAIKTGYRLIDTAASYGNEREVGEAILEAINQGIVKREELFVTSKMWVQDVGSRCFCTAGNCRHPIFITTFKFRLLRFILDTPTL